MRREEKIIVSLIVVGLSFLIGCKRGAEGMNDNNIEVIIKELKEKIRRSEVKAAEAAYYLGNIAFLEIKFDETLKYYEEAVKLEPRNPHYLDAIGFVYLILKKYDEAIKSYKLALSINREVYGEGHPDVVHNLRRLNEAIEETKKTLKQTKPEKGQEQKNDL